MQIKCTHKQTNKTKNVNVHFCLFSEKKKRAQNIQNVTKIKKNVRNKKINNKTHALFITQPII